jgi:hypothetical protein
LKWPDEQTESPRAPAFVTTTLLALALPFVGFMVGATYRAKGTALDLALAEHLFLTCFVSTVLWLVAGLASVRLM